MVRILLIQNPSRPEVVEAEQQNYRTALGTGVELTYLSSLDESLSWMHPEEVMEGYDGVMFGGSRDYDFDGARKANDPFRLLAMLILSRTRNLIGYALEKNIPVIGICFGHQSAANLHGGEVKCDPDQKKRGTYAVSLTDDGKSDPIFGNLPATFDAQYGHKDSVTKHPNGATLLASGEHCRFSALRYGDSMYTVQFHPEITASRMIAGMNSDASSLPKGITDASMIVRQSPDAARIIPLWVEKIVGKKSPARDQKQQVQKDSATS